MIKLGRNRIIAATGTLVAHIVVMILLLCSTLSSTIATPEEDRGVYIQLGTIDEASGTFRPYYPEPVTEQGAQETVVEDYKGIYVQECTYCEIMPLYIGTLKLVDIFLT